MPLDVIWRTRNNQPLLLFRGNSNPNFPVALSINLTLAENSLFVLELTNPFNSPVIPFVSKVSTCLSERALPEKFFQILNSHPVQK